MMFGFASVQLPYLPYSYRPFHVRHHHHRVNLRPIEDVVSALPVPHVGGGRVLRTSGNAEVLECRHVLAIMLDFANSTEVKTRARAEGITALLFHKAIASFRDHLVIGLNIGLGEKMEKQLIRINKNNAELPLLIPYFIRHCKLAFPYLDSSLELSCVADFTHMPNQACFEQARRLERHFTYHAGPANSGKTYAALERFKGAHRAIYCCPLRLLATEVYNRAAPLLCNMITGQERRMVAGATHTSCTIEMLDLERRYDVAVIDEIQMLGHEQRGWAWTRAVMGLAANEIHLCGDPSAIPLMRRLLALTGEHMAVRKKSSQGLPILVELVSVSQMGGYATLREGDCVICFCKKDLFQIGRELRTYGLRFSLIFGDLPNPVKISEAERFNRKKNTVLLATDAIGMGLNLNIRRVIFHSLRRPTEASFLTPAEVQQIAGRAARQQSDYPRGFVTTYLDEDLPTLGRLFHQEVEDLPRAGVQPTYEQLESFSQLLPGHSFRQVLDAFSSTLCTLGDNFLLCGDECVKEWEEKLNHLSLDFKQMYTLCHVPSRASVPFVANAVKAIAVRLADDSIIDMGFVRGLVAGWQREPTTTRDLTRLTDAYDVVGVCIWLSHRFEDFFTQVTEMGELSMNIVLAINECLEKKTIF